MNFGKTILSSLLIISVSFLAGNAFAAPSKVSVTGQANFISDAPLEKINGTAPVSGEFEIDFDKPDIVKGSFKLPVEKMETGNKTRDEHLRGGEWLNAAKCPNIEFKVTEGKVGEAKPANDKGISTMQLSVKGMMTINCTEQETTMDVIIKRKGDKAKIGSEFNIKLADFKVAGKEGVVGKKVGESIAVRINLKGK
jgi:polyisoprenoid-binding protein YceI